MSSTEPSTPAQRGRREVIGTGLAIALGALLEACGSSSSKGATATASGPATGKGSLPATTLQQLASTQPAVATFDFLDSELPVAHQTAVVAQGGPYTIFVPTTDALSSALTTLVAEHHLPTDGGDLLRLVQGMVVAGALTSADLAANSGSTVRLLDGRDLGVAAEGGSITVGDAVVLVPDLLFAGGVIHLVDTLLIDPELRSSITSPSVAPGTIADVVTQQNDLSLAAAVFCAPVFQGMLENPGITALVPDDAAVQGQLTAWVAGQLPGNPDELIQLVFAHVIGGQMDIAALSAMNGQSTMTLAGPQVPITVTDGKVQVGGATILRSIPASNGILHVVDNVVRTPA